jgi:hypothetical protein
MQNNRLMKEFRELSRGKGDTEISLSLENDNSLLRWDGVLQGPPGTPYEGGRFELKLVCTTAYPLAPPQVRFVTNVFHPNVLFKVRATHRLPEPIACRIPAACLASLPSLPPTLRPHPSGPASPSPIGRHALVDRRDLPRHPQSRRLDSSLDTAVRLPRGDRAPLVARSGQPPQLRRGQLDPKRRHERVQFDGQDVHAAARDGRCSARRRVAVEALSSVEERCADSIAVLFSFEAPISHPREPRGRAPSDNRQVRSACAASMARVGARPHSWRNSIPFPRSLVGPSVHLGPIHSSPHIRQLTQP